MNRYRTHYDNIISFDLIYKDHYINVMQLPKLDNIVLNMGLGKKAILEKKHVVTSLMALEIITKQKACPTRAKKSIDQFKVRKNMLLGSKVTLRNKNMYRFFDKLTHTVLPHIDQLSDMVLHTKEKKALKLKTKHFLPKRTFYHDVDLNKKLAHLYSSATSHTFSSDYLHSFYFLNNISNPSQHYSFRQQQYYSLTFGLNDFFVFNEIPYDKFLSSFGLNLVFSFRFLKKKRSNHLLPPHYILTCFQMPLGIPSC